MSIIELKNIEKQYGEHRIFDGYEMKAEQGEFVAITGKSGSGKTTLLNMIGLLDSPDSGSITICGVENPRIDSRTGRRLLRFYISYLFQNYGLVEDRTVEYNMKMAVRFAKLNRYERTEQIAQALKTVGLADYEKKKVYQLSGGEQQRVALAKIMVKPTEIILADEPTGKYKLVQ